MPVSLTYPGVYIEEVSSGVRTIVGASTSVAAFVGYTERGPSHQPVRIFNFGDYEREFGGLNRGSAVSYAVQQFYTNGGGEAYVVRVATGATPAKISLKDSQGNVVLTAIAASDGKWGNSLAVEVDYHTQAPDSSFNLTVTHYSNQNGKRVSLQQEKYLNLSMNSKAAKSAVDVVNASSKLIKLERPNITFDQQGYYLSGKLDPFPTLTLRTSQLSGQLDGGENFELRLTEPLPTDIGELVSNLNGAIANSELDNNRLQVERTDALGTPDNTGGQYLKFTSTNSSDPEQSAVSFGRAPLNDAASVLQLESPNHKRVDGAANRRPVLNGTTSGNLAAVAAENITGTIKLQIKNAVTQGTLLRETSISIDLSDTVTPQTIRDELQRAIRSIDHAATRTATVKLAGSHLHILLGSEVADLADLVVEFTDPSSPELAGVLRLENGQGALNNVAQYSLGIGSDVAFQQGAVSGNNGSAPGATELIGSEDAKEGLYALKDAERFNLLLIPGAAALGRDNAATVFSRAASFCEQQRAFLLIDPPANETATTIADWAQQATTSRNAALFFPQATIKDPLDDMRPRAMPASGSIAGIMARTDAQRGIWKAPAGIDATVNNILGPAQLLTDGENGVLNPLGINCIRKFPIYGSVVWGARTRRGADAFADEYKYIPVRRLALYLEESLFQGLKWVMFEPNDEPLWAQIRLNVGAFMQNLFRQGALKGSTPREAYLVQCDAETTTQNDINLGIVNVVVGFAPLKPAEFVVIKLQQLAGQIQV